MLRNYKVAVAGIALIFVASLVALRMSQKPGRDQVGSARSQSAPQSDLELMLRTDDASLATKLIDTNSRLLPKNIVERLSAAGCARALEVFLANGWNVAGEEGNGLPLHYAASRGNEKCVKVLLDHGASVDLYPRQFASPTALAASIPDETEMLTALLRAGANPNRVERVKNVRTREGKVYDLVGTALFFAVHYRRIEAVRVLIEHGADPYIKGKGKDDLSPLELSQKTGQKEISEIFSTVGFRR